MTRPTKQELWDRLESARRRVPFGRCYLHQASGDAYEIIGHSIRESDGEVLLTYTPAFGVVVPFTRPYSEFFEIVDMPGGHGPRFRNIRFEEINRG